MKVVSLSLEGGDRYFARIDGQRFFVGKRVSYEGNKGLMNVTADGAPRYDPNAYRPAHGFWADFIQPTAQCEGALFHTLNTYDSARFTFSFLQFAAHVPDGDFVRYLRGLLALPQASEYFPDLVLEQGRICRAKDGVPKPVPLESATSTEGLMDYFNPASKEIEDTEVITSALLIHWARNDAKHRDWQVECGVRHIEANMASYAKRYALDGAPDVVCLVVADIRHQGRAKSPAIETALKAADPLEALLKLGASDYKQRIATLRAEIKKGVAAGVLGKHRYSAAQRKFV